MPERSGGGLSRKPWGVLSLALAILGLVLGVITYREYLDAVTNEEVSLMAQAQVVGRIMGGNLMALHGVLGSLGEEVAREGIAPDLDVRLKTLARAMPGVRTLLVLNASGRVTASNRPEIVAKDLGQRGYFKAVAEHPDPRSLFVSPPFVTALGVYALNVSRMIEDAEGHLAGVVTATLDPDYFIPLLRSVRYAPDMWAAVAHGSGVQFLMEPDREGMSGKNLAQPGSFFSRHRDSDRQANVLTGTVYATGQDCMMAVVTVSPPELPMDMPLVVGAARVMADILAPWRDHALLHAGLYGLVCLIAAGGLAIHRRRQRKMRRLADEAEATTRLLLDAVSEGVYGADTEGRITFINPSALRMLGYERAEEALGRDNHALMHHTRPDGTPYPVEECLLRRAISHHETVRCDTEVFWRKDGASFDVSYAAAPVVRDGRLFGAVVTFMDVTERRRAEEALRTASERLKLATGTANIGIWDYDLARDALVWDEAMYRLYGVDPGRFNGAYEAWESGVHPEDLEATKAAIKRCLDGIEDFSAEFRVIWPEDGSIHYIMAHGLARRDAEGRPTRLLGVNWDVTARRRAEEELRQAHDLLEVRVRERTAELRRTVAELEIARDQAESANRMKADFLANVSHELRTPLSPVMAFTDLTLDGELDPEQRENLVEVRRAATRLHEMIEDLITLTGLDASQPVYEAVVPAMLLDLVGDEVHSRLEAKELALSVDIQPQAPERIDTDMRLVGIALRSLVDNAVKFTDAGRVRLGLTGQREPDGRVWAVFSVTDSGLGIPEDKIPGIVAGLAQGEAPLTKRFGGLGLGMAKVHKVLALLGGRLVIETEPGRGSTFSLILPPGPPPVAGHGPRAGDEAADTP